MELKDILHLVGTLAMFVKMAHGQSAAYVCKQTNVTGSEFEVIFKYFRGGNTLATSLISYDASAHPNISTAVGGAACGTQTVEDDILTLQYTVDVNAVLPCGISQDPDSPSLYRIAIVANETSTYFTFACNISNLQLPNEVSVDSFATGHLMNIGEVQIEHNLVAKLEVLTPDGRPVSTARVGDSVKLQFSYNINNTNNVQDTAATVNGDPSPDTVSIMSDNTSDISDNFGTVFHMAYPLRANTFLYTIVTLSENSTNVQVVFSFNGSFESRVVQTSRSTPYVGTYTFDYVPTASPINWTIINFGLKVQSLGEEIGVILKIDEDKHEMVLQPDDVLGKGYRFFAYGDNAGCLIVGTENNTDVTFDLSNFRDDGVEIAGINFATGSEATVVIHEYEAIEMMCSDRCQTLSIKSNKSVSVLCGSLSVVQIPEINKLYREFILYHSLNGHINRNIHLISGKISTAVEYTVENITKSLNGTDIGLEFTNSVSGKYLSSTGPVLLVQQSVDPTAPATNVMVVPSIIQWSDQYYFYLEHSFYRFLVTSTEQDIGSIIVIGPTFTLNIKNLLQGSVFTSELGVSYGSMAFPLATMGWIEFNSNGTGAPFGIYAVRSGSRGPPIPTIPFRMRFPCVSASTGEIVSCNHSQTNVPPAVMETPDAPSPDTPNIMSDNTSAIPDNIGTVFHMAYPLPANNFRYRIVTLSENPTNVQVVFSFNGSVENILVQTSRSTPYIGSYSFVYVPTATPINWTIINFGLKIQSFGEEIGVILEIDGDTHEIVLQPDDVLEKEYRFFADGDNASCLIVGTESNTDVTFDLSSFREDSVEIEGIHFASGSEATVVIHEYEAIEMMCSDRCQTLSIKSNKSVAVFCGSSSVVQIPEINKLYREFILYQSLNKNVNRTIQLISGDISTAVEYTVENITKSLNGTDIGLENTNSFFGKYLSSTGPILIVQESVHRTAPATNFMVAQSIIQWSTRYYFHLKNSFYRFLLTSTEQDIGSIIVIGPTFTLNVVNFLQGSVFTSELGRYDKYSETLIFRPPLGPLSAGLNDQVVQFNPCLHKFAIYTGVSYRSMNFAISAEGWIEFHSNETGAPFGVYAVRSIFQGSPIPTIPFRTRFPCVSESTGEIVSCNPPQTKGPSTTKETPVTDSPGLLQTRLRLDKLTVSDTGNFSGHNVITLHRQGCNTDEARPAIPEVSSFKRETKVSDRWEMETDVFKMFRFRGSPYMCIRITFGICFPDEHGSCTATCTGREKRSTESHHVDLQIKVTDDIDDENKPGQLQVHCESTIIYWIPHMILLMIIIIEVLATSYFLMKKWKLKQS